MRTTTCVLVTVLAVARIAAGQGLADVDSDAGDTTAKMPRRSVRTTRESRPEEEDSDRLNEDPRLAAPVPPRALKRPAADSKATKKAGRTVDPFLDDAEEAAPATSRKPAGRANRSRDAEVPDRRTTINRAAIKAPRIRENLPTEPESQMDDDDANRRFAADERPAPRGVVAASADVPAQSLAPRTAPRTFATAQDDGVPDLQSSTPSLEEQIEELRARLDQLTRVPEQNASLISNTTSSPSTVQGSVFEADNTSASGTFLSDGQTFKSKDGNFKYHLGGLVQLDVIGFAPNTPGIKTIPGGAGIQDSVEFRRLRVRAEGTMYNNIDWVSEFDFALSLQNTDQLNAAQQSLGLRSFPTGTGVQAGNTINVIQPTVIFMTLKDVPILGNVRVGTQPNWISIEHIESARFLDFMERAPIMDVFNGANNNGYAPGISAFNNTPDQRAGLQIGMYKNTIYDSGFTYNIGDAWIYGGRAIFSPYYDEESKGRYMVHTAIGGEYRTLNTNVSATTGFDNVRVRSRGELRNAASTLDPNYADTGNFYAISQSVINPELAIVWGPWLFQAEYSAGWFNGAKPAANVATKLGNVFMEGGYVETLYFLTGENRTYNRQQGTFGRVIPKENANFKDGTWGAWQVGLRYDWVDLNSGTLVNGGNASDLTVGLNWFLNPNARFQFNYVMAWVNNAPPVTFPGTVGALNGSRFVGDGTINSFGGRMDFTF